MTGKGGMFGGLKAAQEQVRGEEPPAPADASQYDWGRIEALQVRLPRQLKRRYQDLVFRADDQLRGISQEEYAAALIHLALNDPELQARVLEQARAFRRERLG